MNARDKVLLEYEHLPSGTSLASQMCPACRGGDSGEHTLSVSSTDTGIVWMCHRASCTFRGGSGGVRAVSSKLQTSAPAVRGVVGKTLIREAEVLTPSTKDYLFDTYGLTASTLSRFNVGYDTKSDRVVLPVIDKDNEVVGAMLRSFSGATPKTISHTEPDSIAWYMRPQKDVLVVVEDQLSAMRVWQYGFSSVALLGTHMNMQRVLEIKKAGYKRVLLALDKDATGKAVKHVVTYRSVLPMLILPLSKDIKDQSEQELTKLFSGLS